MFPLSDVHTNLAVMAHLFEETLYYLLMMIHIVNFDLPLFTIVVLIPLSIIKKEPIAYFYILLCTD